LDYLDGGPCVFISESPNCPKKPTNTVKYGAPHANALAEMALILRKKHRHDI